MTNRNSKPNLPKKNNVNYQKKNIINVFDLKRNLEKLDIRMNEHTVLTMDIVAIFPSVKFRMIQKAQNYFVRNTSESDKQQAKLALELN